ncbi:hypothetical protein [Methylobacterium sp. WL18]|uniref:hypothetical protein n=1 Tax=Methylobacterium sp. WL18 TaxID=2603897 RepID=UPI00164FFDBA|nr:hypothetical protein [Methylobacterium sp. WL18]
MVNDSIFLMTAPALEVQPAPAARCNVSARPDDRASTCRDAGASLFSTCRAVKTASIGMCRTALI